MSKQYKTVLYFFQVILLLTFISPSAAMERRRDQFNKEPGHYIVPVPISYPGIGEGLAAIAIAANAHDSYNDYGVFLLGGDFEGFGAIATDMHLIDKTLIAEVAAERLSKVAVFSYYTRGMDSGKNEYNILEVDKVESTVARLRGSFQNRMFEVQSLLVKHKFHLSGLRDENGNLLVDTRNSADIEQEFLMLSFKLDWTDDYQDPRKGIRYDFARWDGGDAGPDSPEYYQLEHNLTGYIPVGRISSVALNYFRSDAIVDRQGDTNYASVERKMDLNCASLPAEHRARCEKQVNSAIAHNRYGTAASMGGPSRLRSYPQGRYQGAHAIFYGAEFRWNLTEEFQPFNIGVARDIRTGIQLSAFWETASVADDKARLGDTWRDSYGLGMRLVMTSGLVFRAELADGDEGSNLVMFFNYPWEGY